MRDVAIDATLRAAAYRGCDRDGGRIDIRLQDLREKVRRRRAPLSIGLVVDNSYSVHADQMVERAKGLARALLADAWSNGDRVALIAFKSTRPEAKVVLPLTRSRALAERRLEAIPIAGRTPLASAIKLTGLVLRQEQLKRRGAIPLAILITDGLPTVALRPGGDPLADALAEARVLRRRKITTIVVDSSSPDLACGGCAPELAEATGGHFLPFDQLVLDS